MDLFAEQAFMSSTDRCTDDTVNGFEENEAREQERVGARVVFGSMVVKICEQMENLEKMTEKKNHQTKESSRRGFMKGGTLHKIGSIPVFLKN